MVSVVLVASSVFVRYPSSSEKEGFSESSFSRDSRKLRASRVSRESQTSGKQRRFRSFSRELEI